MRQIASRTFTAFDKQTEFLNLCKKVRFPLCCNGIQTGKTAILQHIGMEKAWNNPDKDKPVVFGAPTYDMVRKISWKEFIEYHRPLIDMKQASKYEWTLKLKNGQSVWFRSAHEPELWRGFKAAAIIADEIQDWPGESFDNAIGRLTKSRGPLISGCTPDGYDHVYERYEERPTEQHKYINWSMYENPHLPKESIEEFEASLSSDYAKQEVYGLWVNMTGSPFKKFDPKHNVINVNQLIDLMGQVSHTKDVKIMNDDHGFRCWVAGQEIQPIFTMDFNVDPMTCAVLFDINNTIFIVDHFEIKDSETEDICIKIRKKYKGEFRIYPDPTGKARHASAQKRRTSFSILKEYGFRVMAKSVSPHQRDRIEETNRMICNAQGIRSLFVLDTCKPVSNSFLYTEWDKDKNKIKKNGKEHYTDQIGYYCDYEHPITSFIREYIKNES